MTSVTVDKLMAELIELKTLRVEDKDSFDLMGDAVVTSLAAKIEQVTGLTTPQSMGLQKAVTGLGLDAEVIAPLRGAIKTALLSAQNELSRPTTFTKGTGKHGQDLLFPCNYCTKQIMDDLFSPDKTSEEAELSVAVLLRKLGVVVASEQTKGQWVALLAYAEVRRTGVFPSYWDLYNTVQQFQTILDAIDTVDGTLVGPTEYPNTPNLLPQALYDQAYDERHPPVAHDLPRVRQIAASYVPLRDTSKLLKNETSKSHHKHQRPNQRSKGRALRDQSPLPMLTDCRRANRATSTNRRRRDSRSRSRGSYRGRSGRTVPLALRDRSRTPKRSRSRGRSRDRSHRRNASGRRASGAHSFERRSDRSRRSSSVGHHSAGGAGTNGIDRSGGDRGDMKGDDRHAKDESSDSECPSATRRVKKQRDGEGGGGSQTRDRESQKGG